MILPARIVPYSPLSLGPRNLARLGGLLGALLLGCTSAPQAPNPAIAQPAAQSVPAAPALREKGVPLEREIRAAETHEYRIEANAGDYARVTVDQSKVDVALRLVGPEGEEIAAADGVGGRKEPELVSWIAQTAGDYRLLITPHVPAKSGQYRVTLEDLRPAVPADPQRIAAESAESEASHWQALEDSASKNKAVALFEQSLAVWHEVGDPLREIEALNSLGVIHRGLGDTNKAISLYDKALILSKEVADKRGEAKTQNNLGVAYHQLGQNQAALRHLQIALALWEPLQDFHELATTLYCLGTVQFDSGDLDAALFSLNRALDLRKKAQDVAGQALILTGIASVHRDRGEAAKALAIYRQALEISRSVEDRNDEANVLQNMGSIYLRTGEVQAALELFTAALEIHQRLGSRGPEGRVLAYLGATSVYLGDTERALSYYRRALQIHGEMENAVWQAYTLRDIGWVYDLRSEPQVALEHYTQAYDIGVKVQDRRSQAAYLQGMGRAKLALEEPQEAADFLEKAVALHRETDNALGEINCLTDLGRAYQALSDPERAVELFRRALDLSRQRKTLVAEAGAQAAFAKLERERGHLSEAAAAMEEALRIVESIRPKVASQRQRINFFASRREYYDFYVDLQARMHVQDPAGGHLEKALAASEGARARSLLDLIADGRIEVRQGIRPELKQKEEELGNRISLLQSQLLDDLSRGGKSAGRIEGDLDQAEEERERLEWEIRRDHPHYATFRHPAPIAPEQVQKLLDERSVFLEYCVGKEASYLFVVTHNGLAAHPLPPAAELADLVESFRSTIARPGRRNYRRFVELAEQLYKVLIAPAAPVLRDRSRLIISPDGPLLLLSFEALLSESVPQSERGYGTLPYLIRDKSVTYVPSASVLAELGNLKSNVPAAFANLLVGFADPTYPQEHPPSPDETSSPLARALEDAGLPSPPRLRESRNELLGIAGLYPKSQVRLFMDDEASEENVKNNVEMKRARFIHFAVHGFLSERRPELSGLVMALDGSHHEDGLLQVYEIFNLELSAELVVLSACDTGLGKNVSGEGLLGVSRALLYAGAANVIVSLWQVSDVSTSRLMVSFYRHLNQSGDLAEALRLARLELVQSELYSNPYYWAPFVLIGGPGTVVTSHRFARQ